MLKLTNTENCHQGSGVTGLRRVSGFPEYTGWSREVFLRFSHLGTQRLVAVMIQEGLVIM
jgi:hypothetical protein